jgi:hypothetical protein
LDRQVRCIPPAVNARLVGTVGRCSNRYRWSSGYSPQELDRVDASSEFNPGLAQFSAPKNGEQCKSTNVNW